MPLADTLEGAAVVLPATLVLVATLTEEPLLVRVLVEMVDGPAVTSDAATLPLFVVTTTANSGSKVRLFAVLVLFRAAVARAVDATVVSEAESESVVGKSIDGSGMIRRSL